MLHMAMGTCPKVVSVQKIVQNKFKMLQLMTIAKTQINYNLHLDKQENYLVNL